MPSVSVIIPTYKHRDYVLKALESVFAQTFTDYEVVVINDGSPDDTEDLLRPLVESGRIRYFKQVNGGQATARNRGVSEARGEFIGLLDDDDLWPQDKLMWQVAAMRENPAAVVVYGFVELIENGGGHRYPGPGAPCGKVLQAFAGEGWIRSPGQTLIRKGAIDRIGGFDPEIWGTDDWDLYLRLAREGDFIFEHRLALQYRCHASNASNDFWRMYQNGLKVIAKNFSNGDRLLKRKAAKFVQRFCGDDAIAAAQALTANGNWNAARKCWLRAGWICPSIILNRACQKKLLLAMFPATLGRLAMSVIHQKKTRAHEAPGASSASAPSLSILVVTPHLPKPDQSSGDRRLCELLALLAKEHRVDLYAPQVWEQPDMARRYIEGLEGAGVYVHPDAWRGIESALAHRRYDVVIIEFWYLAEKFSSTILRWQPWAKIAVDTVDVHFMREEAGLALGLSDAQSVNARKQRELAAYLRADAVLVVTEDDRKALAKHAIQNLFVVPNILPLRPRRAMQRGHDVLFVGGFAHTPNVDGICWFASNVWPQVRARVPDAGLFIIGIDAPPEVEALSGSHGIELLGYVADLSPFLDRAAVSVAPLRYGGGMKGKVTEALVAGIPVVATSIGAQGFGALSGQHMIIADADEAFASAVVSLLHNPEDAEAMARAGTRLVSDLCSPEVVQESVGRLIAAVGRQRAAQGSGKYFWMMRALLFRIAARIRKLARPLKRLKPKAIKTSATSVKRSQTPPHAASSVGSPLADASLQNRA